MAELCIIVAIGATERRDAAALALQRQLIDRGIRARVVSGSAARAIAGAVAVVVRCDGPHDPAILQALESARACIPVVTSADAVLPATLRACESVVLPAQLDDLVQRVRALTLSPALLVHDLLMSLYTPSHFRRWIGYGPAGAEISAELPEEGVAKDVLIGAGVASMRRHGVVAQDLFGRLAAEFPARRAEIEGVARAVATRPFGSTGTRRGARTPSLWIGAALVVVVAALAIGVEIQTGGISLRHVINNGSMQFESDHSSSQPQAQAQAGPTPAAPLVCPEHREAARPGEPPPVRVAVAALRTDGAGPLGNQAAVELARSLRDYRDASLAPASRTRAPVLQIDCMAEVVATADEARALAARFSVDLVVWGTLHTNLMPVAAVVSNVVVEDSTVAKGGELIVRPVRRPALHDVNVHVTPADPTLVGTSTLRSVDHLKALGEARGELFAPAVVPVFVAQFERRGWGFIAADAAADAVARDSALCADAGRPGESFARVLFFAGDMKGAHTCAEQARAARGAIGPEVQDHVRETLRLVSAVTGDAPAGGAPTSADPKSPASLRRTGAAARSTGDREAAKRQFKAALAGLPEDTPHPLRGLLLRDLGLLAVAGGDRDGGDRLLRQAYQILTRTLGRNHPYTLIVEGELEGSGDASIRSLPWPD